jgi:hypothetical protein
METKTLKEYASLLQNISCEKIDHIDEFEEYISEYYSNYIEFNIDPESSYFEAIEWAHINIAKAWLCYSNY